MSDVRKRAHADHAFGAWFRKAYNQQTLQDGGLRVLNASPRPADDLDLNSSLAKFAELYKQAPTSEIRPVNGVVSFGGRRYSASEFNERVNKAAAAGLI